MLQIEYFGNLNKPSLITCLNFQTTAFCETSIKPHYSYIKGIDSCGLALNPKEKKYGKNPSEIGVKTVYQY